MLLPKISVPFEGLYSSNYSFSGFFLMFSVIIIFSGFVTCASYIFYSQFVSGMQSVCFSESQDAIVCSVLDSYVCSWTNCFRKQRVPETTIPNIFGNKSRNIHEYHKRFCISYHWVKQLYLSTYLVPKSN